MPWRRRGKGALRRRDLSRAVKSEADETQGGKVFTPRLDRHHGRLEALRAMGLITVDNTSAVRNAVDEYIERLLARVNLNVLDLDQIAELMAKGEKPSEAIKRVWKPGEAPRRRGGKPES